MYNTFSKKPLNLGAKDEQYLDELIRTRKPLQQLRYNKRKYRTKKGNFIPLPFHKQALKWFNFKGIYPCEKQLPDIPLDNFSKDDVNNKDEITIDSTTSEDEEEEEEDTTDEELTCEEEMPDGDDLKEDKPNVSIPMVKQWNPMENQIFYIYPSDDWYKKHRCEECTQKLTSGLMMRCRTCGFLYCLACYAQSFSIHYARTEDTHHGGKQEDWEYLTWKDLPKYTTQVNQITQTTTTTTCTTKTTCVTMRDGTTQTHEDMILDQGILESLFPLLEDITFNTDDLFS